MNTYLSIDLDYWVNCHRRRDVDLFFKKVYALGLPIFTAPFHDQLLEHINLSKYDQIINVDYHSDICDDGAELTLTEGTWANYVNHRDTYVWRHPDEGCLSPRVGYCHDTTNPFEHPEAAHWQRASCQHGLRGIPWKNITAVGVCLSKYWLNGNYNPLSNVLTTFGMDGWLCLKAIDQRLCIKPGFTQV